jgi:peptidoglycan L-alanyl-D-glutamate endopeptidase CwlK
MTKLEGVHPELVEKVTRIIAALMSLGFAMVVTDGVRTAEQQHALWQQGRETPGPIVTNADGYTKKSNHQPHEDGFGHAVDLAFVDEQGYPSWGEKWPWAAYGACAKALGLAWGGDWSSPHDRPHIELIG